ncbi:DUF2441 domain-containing protein [Maribacter sp. MMG018]|uniref:DUF2441 domain-containing protein n=1 Tax=Maribacter sp. MMG018 TaxID=2822688 RepID=UPI001B3978BA|nr:DUF2441 domain-containing protein [Maribacter sp. MMG018]MBQ4915319.1 DUF2441 domain-containing protein [Maribacter sp. MMG018]
MRYFHIQILNGIRKEWRKGDSEKTDFNNFYKDILNGIDNISKFNFQGKRLIKRAGETLDVEWMDNIDYESKNYEDLFYKVQDLLIEYEGLSNDLYKSHYQHLKLIREDVFEQTRLEINPLLPSRKKCIWLCTTDTIESWWDTFKNHPKKRIIEIELSTMGKKHVADAEYITTELFSIQEWKTLATDYWKGIKSSNPHLEILYEGKFKIINEYEKIELI